MERNARGASRAVARREDKRYVGVMGQHERGDLYANESFAKECQDICSQEHGTRKERKVPYWQDGA